MLATRIPPFVDTARMFDARNFSVVGYNTIRSVRGVLEKTGINLTDEIALKLSRVKFKASVICRSQHSLALQVLNSVETIWNNSLEASPFDSEDFSYGPFLDDTISKIPTTLLPLEKLAESVSHEFANLGDRLAALVANVTDEALLRSPEEQYFFGEALVQFTSSVLFVSNVALQVSSLQAHLLQIGVRVAFVEDGSASIHLILGSLEGLYEAGLGLIVPQELIDNVCVDAML